MKKLTIHRMALARLRANAKVYRTMTAGIFLAVFLATTLCLAIQGVFLAKLDQKNRQAGYLDVIELDNPDYTDEAIMGTELFEKLGHVTVAGQAGDTELYLGYADESGYALMNYRLKEGRMPESPGEIAMEQSALLALDESLTVGSSIDLTVTPVEGVGELRSFTLVGILREKTEYLEMSYGGIRYTDSTVTKFPSILLSPQEPIFRSGRLAVHRVMSLKKGISLRAAVASFREDYFITHMRYITPTGQVLSYYDDLPTVNAMGEEVTMLLVCIVFLAVSLLTGCCVGIAGSMDAVLSKRGEEIGILRAVGATRRQIRRIYGRESFLLAALVSPLAIGCGCLGVAALSWVLPEQIRFRATLWLLLPVAALSAVVIFLAGWLPLNRASRKMPMSVLRDTELLRKAGKLKSSRSFLPARLLALRRLRLYPGRQVGTMLLTMLMLVSAGLMGCLVTEPINSYAQGVSAFHLYIGTGGLRYGSYINDLSGHAPTWEDMAQIAALPKVTGVEVTCQYYLTLLAEGESSYFKKERFPDEEEIKKTKARLDTKLLPVPGASLVALEPSLLKSQLGNLTEGELNIDALNSGQEVIVYAPTWWEQKNKDGHGSRAYSGEQRLPGDELVCSNDYFYAGQELNLVQEYVTGPYYDSDGNPSKAEVRRRTVTVGAVTEEGFRAFSFPWSSFTIITTLEGVRKLDLHTDGLYNVDIFIAPGVDRELEDAISQRIEAIARRSSDVSFYNRLASARENAAQIGGMLLLFGSVTLVFFAAAVGMIRSTVTRQLQQDGRTIGMLRAVGAEEKTILSCYSLPAYLSVLLGTALSMSLLALTMVLNNGKEMIPHAMVAMAITSAACLLACRGLLTRQVREITKQSIIDNIREL